ncbi:MAG: tRNA (adenosine(37)-N6)-threonylcarbamoyltransferase complex ATPase subunit type 1 TsaE [Alphaproteobacteria bacterium]|nr:tRNA (adenosine(37)-N6)-threonylcarbamoyltransferase complex ATPase subunit type 1 TsaE [Alphaproteobacteria bacterium]
MIYKKKIICVNENDTLKLAERFAKLACRGDVFALFGTLGAGKSTFSRYFIKALTHALDVPSPTFTLVQIYEAPDFDIYHYDMYRLKNPEEAYELDIEEAFYNNVCLIEWPEKILPLLPKNIWKITIHVEKDSRIFSIETEDADKARKLEVL